MCFVICFLFSFALFLISWRLAVFHGGYLTGKHDPFLLRMHNGLKIQVLICDYDIPILEKCLLSCRANSYGKVLLFWLIL